MRQRHSFRASEWEPLEDRKLMAAAVTFPNLAFLLKTYVRPEAQVIGNPTPPPVGTPNGFIDSRVTLSKADVSKLVTAVDTFYNADKNGGNSTAVAAFRASLISLDQFIATEPQHVPGGGTIKVSGATTNFVLPLLNGATPTAFDVNQLHSDITTFAATYTYGASSARDTIALNELQNEMSVLILSHSHGI